MRTFSELIEGIFLNLIMGVYEKPRANIILRNEKLKACPLRKETRMSTVTTSIQHWTGDSNKCSKARKSVKSIQIGGKVVKLSLFEDNMILCAEESMESPKKSIIINEFSKFAGYKINEQKSSYSSMH